MSLWNGHAAALSLTFDDALPCQLDFAVPAMNLSNIPGTFFAIADCPEYPLNVHNWRRVLAHDHEIGSHSVKHLKAASLSYPQAIVEAKESKRILENHFGRPVTSFCYPYTDAPAPLQNAVKAAGYKQARGGRVARADKYIVPGDGANMLNLPCYHVDNASLEKGDVDSWVLEAFKRRAWLTLMFHGVGTDGTQWDNVFPEQWLRFMRFLEHQRENGLWIAPFGTVAENLRQNGGTK